MVSAYQGSGEEPAMLGGSGQSRQRDYLQVSGDHLQSEVAAAGWHWQERLIVKFQKNTELTTHARRSSRSDHREHRSREGQDHCRNGHGPASGWAGHAGAHAAVFERIVALRGTGRG